MNRATICLITMTILTLSILSVVYYFNVSMDPYCIFDKPLMRPMYLVDDSYLSKVIGVIHKKPNIIITGSSIVDAGFKLTGSATSFHDVDFDKENARLQAKVRPFLPIYNLGVRGGSLYEIYYYILHAYKNNPKLKHIILGVEWRLFTKNQPPTRQLPTVSALGETNMPATFFLQKTLSLNSTFDSLQVWLQNHNLTEQKEKIKQALLRFPDFSKKRLSNSASASNLLNSFSSEPVDFYSMTQQLVLGQRYSDMTGYIFSLWEIDKLREHIKKEKEDALFNPDAFLMMKKIVDFAKEKGIQLDVYISPQHVIYWETLNRFGYFWAVDKWQKQLAQITPYWDFSEVIDFSKKNNTYFITDPLHFKEQAGEIILPTILYKKIDPSSGIRYITKENVQANIKRWHNALEIWLDKNTYMKNVLYSATFDHLLENDNLQERAIPQFYYPNYKRYQIIKLSHNFIALPTNKLPYDYRKIVLGKYKNMQTSQTLQGLLKKIDATS